MALYLVSANPKEVEIAQRLGFVSGIITSPRLIQKSQQDGLKTLETLVEIFDGHVFYQLTANTLEGRLDEAWSAYDIRPDRVVIKLPATTENIQLIQRLPEIDIAFTAVFGLMQAYIAAEAGAHYIMPYVKYPYNPDVNRNAHERIQGMVNLIQPTTTQILAVHIDTLELATEILATGVHHIGLPFPLIQQAADHPHTQQALIDLDDLIQEGTPNALKNDA